MAKNESEDDLDDLDEEDLDEDIEEENELADEGFE